MDYKSTLNLPKTDFPMKANLPQREPEMLKAWQEQDIYALMREARTGREKKILHDGPPYANGNIHIGHVLNKTLKDIVVKYWTMKGYDSVYIPGWDCHGLPIEHQLLKELKMGKHQVQKVEFRKKAHEYAMKYVGIQREQFERLGVFADWARPYLTLSRDYEKTIVDSFGALVEAGYIYRGLKPVNWCFKCETALAEAEVEYDNHVSPSIYVKFKVLNPSDRLKNIPRDKSVYAVVWTTTPWTLIANVAIAVHPGFDYDLLDVGNEIWIIQHDLVECVMEKVRENAGIKEYRKLDSMSGEVLRDAPYEDIFRPARSAGFKFVLADYVSKEEGTGLVHTAPGHGQEDYLTGQRCNLETVMPVNGKGEFYQEVAMEFKGEHVFDANQGIIEKLKSQGNLLDAGQINHTYPHCWRCKTPVIFRATEQWFFDIDKDDLRKKLLEAVNKQVAWIPASGKERISSMIELRPHWCLSRQRHWGVPIPALGCNGCAQEFLDPKVIKNFAARVAEEGSDCWFKRDLNDFVDATVKCPHCGGSSFIKGSDILDVWFDSGVSHQAVFKNRPELGELPCELYLEGSDQHRGWFQSSLIPSVCIDNRAPFKKVLTHGFVVDGAGRKMSKSLGNVIAPQDIIKDYGADILRLWVASSDYNEDIRISKEILTRLAEAYRKIRNTARFILSNLFDFNPDTDRRAYGDLRRIDIWILHRLHCRLIPSVESSIAGGANGEGAFEFYRAYKALYDFCNQDLSMDYLDMVKGRLYTSARTSQDRRAAQTALYDIISVLTRLLAPFLAFTAEEIRRYMPKEKKDKGIASVHLLPWPAADEEFLKRYAASAEELRVVFELKPEVARMLEGLRGEGTIGSSFDAGIILLTNDQNRYTYLNSLKKEILEIFKISQVAVEKVESHDKGVKSSVYPDITLIVQKALGTKCPRCWNYFEYLGTRDAADEICEGCLRAVEEVKRQ